MRKRCYRPTRADIDLGALRCNVATLRRAVRVPLWGVVKADAYGHGAVQVAQVLADEGASGLCVALLEEAVQLREAGLSLPILVMGDNFTTDGPLFAELNLIPVVSRLEQIRELATACRARGMRLSVHAKLDTGMSRLGCPPEHWVALLDGIREEPQLEVTGLMTHLAGADCDADSVARQLVRFESGCEKLRGWEWQRWKRHAANTAGALGHPEARFDFVRVGIGLYGYAPGVSAAPALLPVMRLRSELVALRWLEPGESVGYGGSWRSARRSLIATVPIGYGDGLSRALSNCGHLLVRSQRVPIVGKISMDMTTLDVTDVHGVCVGDEAVIVGSQSGHWGTTRLGAEEVAEASGTIAWEVLCTVSRRVPRVYLDPK